MKNVYLVNFIAAILCLSAAAIKIYCGEIGFFVIDAIVGLLNLFLGFRWLKNIKKD